MSKKHTVADSSLFRHCTTRQRRRLEQLSTPIEVKAGYQLTRQGHTGQEFGVIIEGTAVVTIDGRPVAELGAGDHYGEVALLDEISHTGGRRVATVTAETDLWVSVMSIAEFRTVLADLPEVDEAIRRAARDRAGSAAH
jgi:CRP-like cAMP-binding protein